MNETNTERVLAALAIAPSTKWEELLADDSQYLRPDQIAVKEAMVEFPNFFMLPNDVVACVNFGTSFVSEGRVLLYTCCLNDDLCWRDYAKGTVAELRSNLRRITRADIIAIIDRCNVNPPNTTFGA